MKMKAVVWIAERRIANVDMQISYDCDPAVLQYFHDRFIVSEVPGLEKVQIFEATEKEWAEFAKAWNQAEPLNRESSRLLH